MQNLFNNFETVKLIVENREAINFLILVILCSLFFLRLKRHPDSFEFLDALQTGQLKGLAIVLVIVGHFWWHVAEKKPTLVFSGDAVALFFLLSGFGLTMSNRNRPLDLRHFLSRRVKRVMIPYWLATIFLLGLDFFILDRTYPVKDVLLTALGINISPITTHIDYVRWYITLLLLWYALHFFATSKLKESARIPFLGGCGAILFLIDYYITPFFWYQIFAFPTGCLVASCYNTCRKIFLTKHKMILASAVFLFSFTLAYKVWIIHFLLNEAPYPLVKLFNEFNSILISLCLAVFIIFLRFNKYYSSILQWIGKYSYELFLLHGAFLVKYNPVISSNEPFLVVIQLFIFLIFISLTAFIFQRIDKATDAIL